VLVLGILLLEVHVIDATSPPTLLVLVENLKIEIFLSLSSMFTQKFFFLLLSAALCRHKLLGCT
jgi:hypothetical protein